jgi:hypothetical protein
MTLSIVNWWKTTRWLLPLIAIPWNNHEISSMNLFDHQTRFYACIPSLTSRDAEFFWYFNLFPESSVWFGGITPGCSFLQLISC